MFVGVDVHKHSLCACYYRNAKEFRYESFPFTKKGFQAFLKSLTRRDEVAIESVTQAYYLTEQLNPRVKRVAVVNTFAFDLIKRSRAKTDEKDAYHLAEQLSHGHLPEVQLQDRTIRNLRVYQNAPARLPECSSGPGGGADTPEESYPRSVPDARHRHRSEASLEPQGSGGAQA
ncbi:MAG: IS110 family transposase [Planctomycetota bacterium]